MKLPAFVLALAAAAALTLPAADGAAQRRAAGPAAKAPADWTRTVVATPQGGFRMGNPNAPVKVIEFLSMTCPHCAQFAAEATPRLIQNYVRGGRVSIEYRNYVLNGYDLAAALINRCAAPARYFELNHALLAGQRQWMARIDALSDAQRGELRGLQPLQAIQRIVHLLGLDSIAARHGVAPSVQRTCLANQAAFTRLSEMQQAASRDFGIEGTPSFVVNGRLAEHVHDWAALEPLLSGR